MNPPSAEAALRKALELDPQNGCARIELGALYEDQGKFAQAAAEFERAIAIGPNHGGAHCQLGRIYRRQGRLPEAEAALRKALALDPQDGWARFELGALCQSHIELGVVCEDQSKFDEAAAEFERVIAIDPNHGGAHRHLGQIYRRQGRWPEAEASLRKALELNTQDGCVRIELGVLYEIQGEFAQAAREFERAIALEPNHGGAHGHLGQIYRRQGRLPEAEASLRKALELDPQNGWARSELHALCQNHVESGVLCKDQDRFVEGEAEFKKALAIEPKNDRAYMGLWAIYHRQGRAAEAGAALTQAVTIDPRSALACTELLDCIDQDRVMDGMAVRTGSGAGVTDRAAPGRRGPTGTDAPFWPSPSQDAPKELMRERVFCLLPWTCLLIFTDGKCCPCCAWGGPPLGNGRSSSLAELWNSPGMKALRLDMMNGRPVAGCWRCYEDERSGIFSIRQRNNIVFDRHRGRERLTAPDGTLPPLPVPALDIRFSNACNLRCRICGPTQSSAWMADARALGWPTEGGPLQKPYDDWDSLWRQLQPLLEAGVEEISFVGGEPLLMEEHYRILDFLIARKLTDVRLFYSTNFSTLRFQGRDAIDLWSRFRDVHVGASLDGSGRRGEYLRKGLRWETAVANREEMLRRCPEVKFVISATVSIFNALHLPDFHREWVEKGYIDCNDFELKMLVFPALYRMQVLPAALKQRVLESYRRHRESFLDTDGSAARDFAATAHALQAQDYSELLPGFVAMTRRLDQLRGEDCREVFPELAALFEAAA